MQGCGFAEIKIVAIVVCGVSILMTVKQKWSEMQMARKRRRVAGYNRSDKAFQKLFIDAWINTPLILLGRTKRTKKKAMRKWFKLF